MLPVVDTRQPLMKTASKAGRRGQLVIPKDEVFVDANVSLLYLTWDHPEPSSLNNQMSSSRFGFCRRTSLVTNTCAPAPSAAERCRASSNPNPEAARKRAAPVTTYRERDTNDRLGNSGSSRS